ncbi:MAG: hypothetical protein ACFFDT_00230 [Candidatus Hodarchaeota archaeon]
MSPQVYHVGFEVRFAEFDCQWRRLVGKYWINKTFQIRKIIDGKVFMKQILKNGKLSVKEVSMTQKYFEQKATIWRDNIREIVNEETGEVIWYCIVHGEEHLMGCDPCGTLHCIECGQHAIKEENYFLCRECELLQEWEEEQDRLIEFEKKHKQEEFGELF